MELILLAVTAYVSWVLVKKSIAISRGRAAVKEEIDFGVFFGVVAGLIGLAFGIASIVEPVALLIGLVANTLAIIAIGLTAKKTGWAHAAPIFGLVFGTLLFFLHVPFGYNLTAGLGFGILGFVIIWTGTERR
jgi:hypothetical protein